MYVRFIGHRKVRAYRDVMGVQEKRVWSESSNPGRGQAESSRNAPLQNVTSEHFFGRAGSTGVFQGRL